MLCLLLLAAGAIVYATFKALNCFFEVLKLDGQFKNHQANLNNGQYAKSNREPNQNACEPRYLGCLNHKHPCLGRQIFNFNYRVLGDLRLHVCNLALNARNGCQPFCLPYKPVDLPRQFNQSTHSGGKLPPLCPRCILHCLVAIGKSLNSCRRFLKKLWVNVHKQINAKTREKSTLGRAKFGTKLDKRP